MDDIFSKITQYFHMGLTYRCISHTLFEKDNIVLSTRHIKRVLQRLQLNRRNHYSDITEVTLFISDQLRNSGQMHGYRWMFSKCKARGLLVKKEDIRYILKVLDPEGVQIRRSRRLQRRLYFSKGPNFIWHIDSYDKLKPFGFCINGCIDGFSRKIIWLNNYYTNSDPRVIGGYYLQAVQSLGGCLLLVRGDAGTENASIKRMHPFLRRDAVLNRDNFQSYLQGASTANQRIECWWAQLRKECIEFWLRLLHMLRDNGSFDGQFLDKSLLQFCLSGMIQDELDAIVEVWNNHNIRPSRNPNVPSGRPMVMHSCPELYNTQDFLQPIQEQDIITCQTHCLNRTTYTCDIDVYNICLHIMNTKNLNWPITPYQAIDLYCLLRNEFMLHL